MRYQTAILVLLTLMLSACGSRVPRSTVYTDNSRLVSIEVEVYDPYTNLVWQDVSVRIVESDQEWSGCLCESPYADEYLTDSSGRVFLDEYHLGDADVGFLEDDSGAAVLGSRFDEDQAWVLLEIDAVGFAPVYVEVPLSWDEPDVFVEVPFY